MEQKPQTLPSWIARPSQTDFSVFPVLYQLFASMWCFFNVKFIVSDFLPSSCPFDLPGPQYPPGEAERAQCRRGPGEHFGEPERMGVLLGPREQYVGLLAPCLLCPLQTSLGVLCLGTRTGLASPGRFEMTLFSKADLSLCAKMCPK